MTQSNQQLLDYRTSIDLLDQAIVYLLAERMRVVTKVGEYKKKNNIPALDQKRWDQVLTNKKTLAKQAGLSEQLIEDIYNRIHDHALEMEENV